MLNLHLSAESVNSGAEADFSDRIIVADCASTACGSRRRSCVPSVMVAFASALRSCLLLPLNLGGSAHSMVSVCRPATQTHLSRFTSPGDVLRRSSLSPGSGMFCKQVQKCKRSRAMFQLLISVFCRIVTMSSSQQQRPAL